MESNREYENRSLMEAHRHMQEIEKAPLADRKEAAQDFFEAMRDDPALVAERLGWLIDGNYGYGEMLKAKQVVASPRMNRVAALTHMIGAYEWQCPTAMSSASWKKLSTQEKKMLDEAVKIVISEAEKEMKEQG